MRKEKFIFSLVNMCVLILIFSLNYVFPYTLDDIQYMSDFYEGGFKNCLFFAFEKTFFGTFLNWSGRMVGNFFAFLMVVLPKAYYNVLNAIVHMALGNIIYQYIRPKKQYDALALALIFMLV